MWSFSCVQKWVLIVLSIILILIVVVGQSGCLINYDLTVKLGLQESVEEVTEVGVVWGKGFGVGDTIVYLPMYVAGLVGFVIKKEWGFYLLFGSLAITAYWPVVCMAASTIGWWNGSMNLGNDKMLGYAVILPLIFLFSIWGMIYLAFTKMKSSSPPQGEVEEEDETQSSSEESNLE